MSLIKRNGDFPSIRSLFTDLMDADRFFDNDTFFRGMRQVPAVNVSETENEFKVEMAAPGLEKKDFKLEMDNGILTVSAQKEEEKKEEKKNYTRQEFSYSSFSRSFQLPETANADAIDAKYQDGVLHITIAKKEEAKTKARKEIAIG